MCIMIKYCYNFLKKIVLKIYTIMTEYLVFKMRQLIISFVYLFAAFTYCHSGRWSDSYPRCFITFKISKCKLKSIYKIKALKTTYNGMTCIAPFSHAFRNHTRAEPGRPRWGEHSRSAVSGTHTLSCYLFGCVNRCFIQNSQRFKF